MSKFSRSQPTIRYETASALVAHALAHGAANGWRIAAVVVDPSGHIIAAGRMDGVPAAVFDIAADKALTTTLGNSTLAFSKRMSSSRELELGLMTRHRLCAWQGGLPIIEDTVPIGGLGVSGASGPEDEACALTALEKMGIGS